MIEKLIKYGELATLDVGQSKTYKMREYWRLNAARQRIQKKTGNRYSMRKTEKTVRVFRTA